MDNNENNNFWSNAKNIGLVFSILASSFAIVLNFFGVPNAVARFWEVINNNFTPENVQFWINIGNILIPTYFLGIFLVSKKISVNYEIKAEKEYDFCELAELKRDAGSKTIPVESKTLLSRYSKRVTALVIQYLWLIRFFAASFVFLYIFIVISSCNPVPLEGNYRAITNFAILTNVFNFLGGVVVFLAFWVLYSETLNKDDKDNRFWLVPVVFAGLYICVFVALSWLFKPGENAFYFLNIFDLIAGSTNGLAMFLLFGRYVSLEQSLSKTNLFQDAFKDLFKSLSPFESKKSYTKIVSFGIIFILPIYALAQPLFGSLEIKLYGDNPKTFQTTVYGVCLIGKLCFFHLTLLIIKNRLLHLYLYGLVSKIGNFRHLEKCLVPTSTKPD